MAPSQYCCGGLQTHRSAHPHAQPGRETRASMQDDAVTIIVKTINELHKRPLRPLRLPDVQALQASIKQPAGQSVLVRHCCGRCYQDQHVGTQISGYDVCRSAAIVTFRHQPAWIVLVLWNGCSFSQLRVSKDCPVFWISNTSPWSSETAIAPPCARAFSGSTRHIQYSTQPLPSVSRYFSCARSSVCAQHAQIQVVGAAGSPWQRSPADGSSSFGQTAAKPARAASAARI